MTQTGESERTTALLTSAAPCEVVSLVSMAIQHSAGKQFSSQVKYFNSFP